MSIVYCEYRRGRSRSLTRSALSPEALSILLLGGAGCEAVGGPPAGWFLTGYVMEVKVTLFSSSFARCSWNSLDERVSWLGS